MAFILIVLILIAAIALGIVGILFNAIVWGIITGLKILVIIVVVGFFLFR